jgi:cell division septum initiation protein DivIVA
LEGLLDILRLIDDLKELAVNRPRQLGPFTFHYDIDQVNASITKIRSSLPNELKQAVQTMRETDRIIDSAREDATMTLDNAKKESERIIGEARKEAEKIVEHARVQQERMIQESEILKLAKAQSEEIRNSADREAVQMRRGAETYAYDVLTQLESVVSKVMNAVERGKNEIDRADTAVVHAPRERARV